MLGSLATNDFLEMYTMVLGDNATDGWLLEFDLDSPGTSLQERNYTTAVMQDLQRKANAGFPVTLGDFWSRDIARHYTPGTTRANFYTSTADADHGASVTWSSVRNLSTYQSVEMPFPIILADAYFPSLDNLSTFEDSPVLVPLQGVVYEFTPLEFGSFDPQLAHFLPTEYLGTSMTNGMVVSKQCVTNYDNAGWVMGGSSDLFHAANLTRPEYWNSAVAPVLDLIDAAFDLTQAHQQLDISAVPNPFYRVTSPAMNLTYPDADETQLRLVDAGMDSQIIPLVPLAVPARNVDLIIVADGSADAMDNTPTGHSITATVARNALLPSGTYNLPPLPKTTNTFVAQRLNLRPTFFGCNGTASELNSTQANATYPLMVYLPNFDPAGTTDTSTVQTAYSRAEASAFLDAAVAIASGGIQDSQGNADAIWPTCLACAVVERSRGKAGVDRTEACEECFGRYCWSEVESKKTEGLVRSAKTIEKRGGFERHSRRRKREADGVAAHGP